MQQNKMSTERRYVFFFTMLSMVIGLLIMNLEIFEDHYVIESFADGQYGRDNTTLWVLSCHYICTFLIKLLSLTGVRLFWYNIFLLIVTLWATYLNFSLIWQADLTHKKTISSLTVLFLTPEIWMQLNWTVVSIYGLVTGGVYIIRMLCANQSLRKYWTVTFLMVLSFSLRIDSEWFAIVVCGCLVFANLFWEFLKKRGSFAKRIVGVFQNNWKLLSFSAIALSLIAILHISYIWLMDIYEPGFLEWNSQRSWIDDYELPPYDEYGEKWNEMGVYWQDYILLQTQNWVDDEYFTPERIQLISDFVKEYQPGQISSLGEGITLAASQMAARPLFLWNLILIGIIVLKRGKSVAFTSLGMAVLYFIMALYFLYRGRLITRITSGIVLCVFITQVYLLSSSTFCKKIAVPLKARKFVALAEVIVCVGILFIKAPLGSDSILGMYKSWCTGNMNMVVTAFTNARNSETYSAELNDMILSDKENAYCVLLSQSWLQHYPLNAKSVFEMNVEGSCDNLFYCGQYLSHLSPIERVKENYEIINPFRQANQANIRFVCRTEELESLMNVITDYIRFHYHPDIAYAVEGLYGENGQMAVVRYETGLEYSKTLDGKISLEERQEEDLPGNLIKIAVRISDSMVLGNGEEYVLCLDDLEGTKRYYHSYKGESESDNEVVFILPYSDLKGSDEYKAQIIVVTKGEKILIGDESYYVPLGTY